MSAGLALVVVPSIFSQTTLVDWAHTWNYMHPTTGALPAGSGTTEPNLGATKWYAPKAEFDATYSGPSFTTAGTGYNAGAGAGPLGYGAMDYFTVAGAEFTALATTLTTPPNTGRYTGYFRTTFTVPADGNSYISPKLRYILDDGGYVYLDGELILRINMAANADNYTGLAANTTNTESNIREADLSLAVGATTGVNAGAAITANATIVKRISLLAAGEHTLAISVHNQAVASSDLGLAAQLQATATDCAIVGNLGVSTRSLNNSPADPTDDSITASLTVVPSGTVGSGWTITGPAGSAAVGKTGLYNAAEAITLPIAEFATGPVNLVISDSGNALCTSTVSMLPQRIIALDDHLGTGLPIVTTGNIPTSGWVFDDAARTAGMINGGGGARKVVSSEVVDLSAIGAVQFSGQLVVVDTSSGCEAADSFTAYLIVDGNSANRINLIDPAQDTGGTGTAGDGILSGGELTPATVGPPPVSGAGTFTHQLRSVVIPSTANSVQIVFEGINDSANENFSVQNLKLAEPPPTIQTTVGTVTFNNQGTVSAADDKISAPVTIEGFSLGVSPGWTSDATPATGLYTDPSPVTFGPFDASLAPVSVTLTDIGNILVTSSFTLNLPTRSLTVGAPTNIVRHENGPGTADDTVTFSLAISGANGGPGWSTTTAGVSPASGAFGTVNFTVAAPLPASPLSVVIDDASYPTTTQTASVAIPGRYILGQRNFGTGLVDVLSDAATTPATVWVNDAVLRTLTNNTGVNGTQAKVESETIDLSAVGEVQFSATLDVSDTSTGSNYEVQDKFKLELIIDGGAPVSLVGPYDTGDGTSAVPFVGGVAVNNGGPDGWINGYTGTASAADGFATALEEYNAHKVRDEFNRNAQDGGENVAAVFTFSHSIPAGANSVKLVLTSEGINGTETVVLKDVLFATGGQPVDSDSDGMTDAYETANGLDPNSDADKNLDKDGDGQSNIQEFLAGTAANDPGSVLKATAVAKGATTASVTWNSVNGKSYGIEISPDLTTGSWVDLGQTYTATGATTSATVDIPQTGTPRGYYLRVKVK